nr:uncharacterized protein LOC104109498 [Nicotiana tomentosiformis]
MAYFGASLTGVASEWFIDQDTSHWHGWDDMAQTFVRQLQYNIDPNRNSLSNLKKKPTESFREYAIKWREQASRVKPPMDDHELITAFLQAQESDYFQNMMSTVGKSFSEAIKIGEMVENGRKTGRILSQVVLKAVTQAVQIKSVNFSDTNEKGEETMMTTGESYARLFEKLKHYDMIAHILPNHVDPRARISDPSKRCEYNSNAQGHNVESCRDLKREIERMIQEKLIVIQDSDTQNIS